MTNRSLILVASLAFSLPMMPASLLAAGDGGAPGQTVNQCRSGKVWDKRQKKCVTPKQSSLDDESIYEAGRDLAKAGRYDDAISVLTLAANKSDPRILNYLGYSHRKQGRILVGFGYYEAALRADPDYTLVREYLGEAHLQLGNVAAAREQLQEIQKRCGTSCEEYADLAAQIASHKG